MSKVQDKELMVRLKSNISGKSAPVEVREFSTTSFELLFLARDIENKIEEGIEPLEIAIFYRNNRDAKAIAHVLEKTRIPFIIESNQNIYFNCKTLHFIAGGERGIDSLVPLAHPTGALRASKSASPICRTLLSISTVRIHSVYIYYWTLVEAQ